MNVDGAVNKLMNGNNKMDTFKCEGGCGGVEVFDQKGNRKDGVTPEKGKTANDYPTR